MWLRIISEENNRIQNKPYHLRQEFSSSSSSLLFVHCLFHVWFPLLSSLTHDPRMMMMTVSFFRLFSFLFNCFLWHFTRRSCASGKSSSLDLQRKRRRRIFVNKNNKKNKYKKGNTETPLAISVKKTSRTIIIVLYNQSILTSCTNHMNICHCVYLVT